MLFAPIAACSVAYFCFLPGVRCTGLRFEEYLDPEIAAAFEDPDAFDDMNEDFVEDFDTPVDGEGEAFDYDAHIAKLMAK
jgi:hypothetical protein